MLLTPDEVAEKLRVKRNTLNVWRYLGKGPKFVKLGNGHIRYRLEDINEFIKDGESHEGG